MIFVGLNLVGCADQNPPGPEEVTGLSRLSVHSSNLGSSNQGAMAQLENTGLSDCDFDATMEDYCDPSPVVDEVDRIIDLPGYCQLKVSYKIYHCDQSQDIYVLQDLDWEWTLPDCFSYYVSMIQNCNSLCQNADDPQACKVECLSELHRQVETALKDFIKEEFMTGAYDPNLPASILRYPPPNCPYRGGPAPVFFRYDLQLCYQWCYETIPDLPIPLWHREVCGTACCVHLWAYCKNVQTGHLELFSSNSYVSGDGCGLFVVCQRGNRSGNCYTSPYCN